MSSFELPHSVSVGCSRHITTFLRFLPILHGLNPASMAWQAWPIQRLHLAAGVTELGRADPVARNGRDHQGWAMK
jgi:hypothetical protein